MSSIRLRLPGLLPQSALLLARSLMRLVRNRPVKPIDVWDAALLAGPGDVRRAEDAAATGAGAAAAWVCVAHSVPSILRRAGKSITIARRPASPRSGFDLFAPLGINRDGEPSDPFVHIDQAARQQGLKR